MVDDLQWKTTSNGRQPPMEDDLQWKTTSNGRQPHFFFKALMKETLYIPQNYDLYFIGEIQRKY
jgi:hypothetical protein